MLAAAVGAGAVVVDEAAAVAAAVVQPVGAAEVDSRRRVAVRRRGRVVAPRERLRQQRAERGQVRQQRQRVVRGQVLRQPALAPAHRWRALVQRRARLPLALARVQRLVLEMLPAALGRRPGRRTNSPTFLVRPRELLEQPGQHAAAAPRRTSCNRAPVRRLAGHVPRPLA